MNLESARPRTALLASLLALASFAVPAVADEVLTLSSHTDAMRVMGQNTPAKDETFTYWFGEDATRYDLGEMSIILRIADKQLFFVNHPKKTYSTIALPFTFESLVPAEMAPMMEMMAKQMAATVTVTPSDKTGNFGGVACTYSHLDIKMAMMSMSTEACNSESLPIDYSRFRQIQESYGELLPNLDWVKEMAEKLKGFPVRSDSTMTVFGNEVKSWQELQSVETRSAPEGNYMPPAGYTETKYDPMAQMQQQGRRKKN